MADDFYAAHLALNPSTGLPVPGAVGQVYALTDTGFLSPLPITDLAGIPMGSLTSGMTGVFPPFLCPGYQRVMVKSGSFVTPMTSDVGSRGSTGAPGVASVVVVTGLEARPAAAVVIWIGGTNRPAGMVDGDLWFQAGPTVPTAPSIQTATLNTLTAGSPFSQQLTASGTTPMTWAVTAGTLPAGVSLSAVGVLTGTPTTAGSYAFTVTAANSQGTDSRGYTGTVTSSVVAPTITTTTLAALSQGAPFSQQLAATGTAPITYTVSAGTLPAGLTLSSSGLLSGTPTGAGTYAFTVQGTNGAGSDTQAYTGTVSGSAVAPVITTTSLNTLSVGSAFSQTLAATGSNPKTWSVSAGTLPAGMTLNPSTGVLSGTPTTAGAYSFTVQATNSGGSDTQPYTGTVAASVVPPTITTTVLDTIQATVPFSQTIARTGSTPMTFGVTAGSLPAGLGLNTSTGTISGTPTTAGAYSFTITATNTAGSDPQAYSGTVTAAPAPAQMSIFGASTPGTSSTVHVDGGGALRVGARFYATKAISVVGLRVWNPPGANSAFLEADVTAYAYPGDWAGSAVMGVISGSPAQTKTHTPTRVAGQWTDVLFDAPVTLAAITSGTAGSDYVTLAVSFAGGDHYVVVAGVPTGAAQPSAADGAVYLAEGNFWRGAHNAGGDPEVNTFYGIDMIFEVV